MSQQFEWDPNKSDTNLQKHGIDFSKATELWEGITVEAPLGDKHGEERWAVFGIIGGKHWTAIITYRSGTIRIISVRRSRKEEEKFYDLKKED